MLQLQDNIREAAENVMGDYGVPGMVIAAAHGAESPIYLLLGTDAAGERLGQDNLFPVASITKLATALAVLRLVDSGKLSLDGLLSQYLPEAAAAQSEVTLRTLLSHSSGLPEDLAHEAARYEQGLNWCTLAEACLKTRLEQPPFTIVRYSNVGYGLLAIIVERTTQRDYAQALQSLVLTPLGIEGYLGSEPTRPVTLLADVRSSHRGTPLEPFNSTFWRSLAFPWAGLTTTAEGALKLARAFYGTPAEFLSPALAAEAVRNQNDDLGGGYGAPFLYKQCPWGLGPDLRGDKKPHWAPEEASPDCFGHAGASGCVTWYDPASDVAWAILGSRTADNGWLLRGSPSIGRAIIESYR